MTSDTNERAGAMGDSTSSLVEECHSNISETTPSANNGNPSSIIDLDIAEVRQVYDYMVVLASESIPCIRVTTRACVDYDIQDRMLVSGPLEHVYNTYPGDLAKHLP